MKMTVIGLSWMQSEDYRVRNGGDFGPKPKVPARGVLDNALGDYLDVACTGFYAEDVDLGWGWD